MSCQFGPDVTQAFLEENQLDYIIRSHEVKAEGYEVAHSGRCVTVFSAPNYWCVPGRVLGGWGASLGAGAHPSCTPLPQSSSIL